MRKAFFLRPLSTALLTFPFVGHALFAQEAQWLAPPRTDTPALAIASAPVPVSTTAQLIVPAGTRLPLVVRNAINTRTAKAGDSVYFETVYPIAANNRIAIPMGTFVRGEILEAKRPGRLRGRGEVRMALQQMTYPNGYTVELRASPSSVDPNSGAGVDASGEMIGPSSAMRDTTAVLLTTAGGAYIGTLSGAATNDAPGKGALIGGGVGGIGALIAVLATRGPEAELPRGTTMDVVFDRPLVLDAALLPAAAGPGIDPQSHYVPAAVDARDRRREPRRNRTPLPRMLPLLFFPLLR
ncbi:MAG TPA: hypothetical protein VI431_01525 [Candidatus Acidoferrum sp.]